MYGFKSILKILHAWFAKPWYPIAISAYPVLALLSANTGQISSVVVVRPLIVSLIFGGLLFFIVWLFFRDVYKAAFLTALLLTLFFTYGHAYIDIDEKYPKSNYTLWLAIGWFVLFVLTAFWVMHPPLTFISFAAILNTIALALLVMSLSQINFGDGPRTVHASELGSKNAPIEADLVKPENPFDVYFFLLDSYARADLLNSAYGFDNSKFINELENRGFFVAKCSQSNYVRTELSLGSSLNMLYLQDLNDTFTPDNIARQVLWDSLRHSAVRYNFEHLGYETVDFDTGFEWLNIRDADHFMGPPVISTGMNQFEGLFLRTTLTRYTLDLGLVDPDYFLGVNFRNRFRYVFNHIDDIVKIKKPTFSYIHIISPHPPFVFDPQGNPTYPPDFWNERRQYPADLYQKGYVNQLQFLNKNMLQAIDTILANSETPPIIIIQGDHGPWLQPEEKRFWNLTAVYFPDHKDKLYSSISPVNIFRLVFNTYFGGKYDILNDVSYFSPVPHVYDFSKEAYPCNYPNN